jgi:hypothetical protein
MTTAVAETNEVAQAEATVKLLISKGVTGLELEQAIDALNAAQGAASRTVERARTAGRLTQEVALEKYEESRARQRDAAAKAERDMMAHAPRITIEYAGRRVTIPLAGGYSDVLQRQILEGTVTRVTRVVSQAFLDAVVSARTLGKPIKPRLLTRDDGTVPVLLEAVRHAERFGVVKIESMN